MITDKVISLPRSIKYSILLLSDSVILMAAIFVSFSLRLGYIFTDSNLDDNKIYFIIMISPLIALPIFIFFGLYRLIIRYIGVSAGLPLIKAVACYSIVWGFIALIMDISGFPRSVVVINFMVTLIGIGGSRIIGRYLLRYGQSLIQRNKIIIKAPLRVLIYGAGDAGHQLVAGLSHSSEYEVYGFVDDNILIQGRDLLGLPIISINEVEEFLDSKKISDIFLAMPSITRKKRNEILKNLLPLKVRVKTSPGLSDLAIGIKSIHKIQELEIDDLLMRDPIKIDEKPLISITRDKVVMVTGAGGSIGSEICRQILKRKPKVIVLLEISEFSLYTIHLELVNVYANINDENKNVSFPRIIPALGSVQDENRIDELIKTWHPNIIYHAAAYKHVPMVEENISEGVKNNIFGTLTLAKAAVKNGVEAFILISTDKAVNPTNVMGATKRVAELILQAISAEKTMVFESKNDKSTIAKQSTNFSQVRFGNVLGSSGSVVPLFRDQINEGGPITLTHKDITRYFMSIPEAVQLVMHSAALKDKNINSCEVYVLDMGKPVKIIDLARKMIELSGFRVKDEIFPKGEIEIKVTGLRKGEKLFEELLIGNNPIRTDHEKILKANEEFISWSMLDDQMQALNHAIDRFDSDLIIDILKELVVGFKPENNNLNFIYTEQEK